MPDSDDADTTNLYQWGFYAQENVQVSTTQKTGMGAYSAGLGTPEWYEIAVLNMPGGDPTDETKQPTIDQKHEGAIYLPPIIVVADDGSGGGIGLDLNHYYTGVSVP